MNILEITTFLRGGAGKFVVNISCMLKDRGHNIDVISSGEVDEMMDWDELKSQLASKEINNYKLNFFKRNNDILWENCKKLKEIISENNYDIIHVHAGNPALAAYIANEMGEYHIPVIGTLHSFSPDRSEWMNIADTWSFNKCKKVFFVSRQYMESKLCKDINVEKKVIYPGLYVDTKEYLITKESNLRQLSKKYNINPKSIIISNLGEITERKGQLDLLKAFAKIKKEFPESILFLVGECRNQQYMAKVKNTIEELKLSNSVIITGWVDDPYKIISFSNLFVFPTYSEGLGSAIVEAISLGVPAIFSKIEGTEDINNILGGSGFGTFEPGDYEDIAAKSIELLKNSDKEIRNKVLNAKLKVDKIFNFKSTVMEYEKEFLNSLDNRGRDKHD